jgi:signal transduction histidine kinase
MAETVKPWSVPYYTGIVAAIGLLLFCAAVAAAPAPDEPYRVLVLHSFRNSLPVNTDWYKGLVRGFASTSGMEVWIDTETLDLARVRDASYLNNLRHIFYRKYRDPKPQLIIPTYTPALQFLLDYGEELFPGIPIVFLGADNRFVAARELPPHITGITTYRDIAGTLELALQVHHDTRRVAVIVGAGRIDKDFERDARQAFQPLAGRIEFLWLRGLPSVELTEAVRQLPPDTVILYLVQLEDRNGKRHVPISTLQVLAPAARAPIYGLWDTLLGHGVIGGRMVTIEEDGFQAAQMALRILRGEAPAAVAVIDRSQNRAIFDGRELVRWHIDEERLPADSEVRHRQLSLWEAYRTGIIVTGLVIGAQGLLILALLLNRSRLRRIQAVLRNEYELRRSAETDSLRQRRKLEKFSKERTLGAMATGIAHEVNQPLIAIQNYAQAAKRRLGGTVEQTHKLTELLEKIEQQADRAGDIIQHIRTLVTTDIPEMRPVSLYSIIAQAIRIMEPECEQRGCRVDCEPAAGLPAVRTDELQIQLVLVNLLQNAVYSIKSMEDKADRVVRIEAREINAREVQVSVADRGPGIPPDRAADIFEPFSSDKGDGMGMGLAICRIIIEAHGGRIRYQPNPSGGAIFAFTLPLAAA